VLWQWSLNYQQKRCSKTRSGTNVFLRPSLGLTRLDRQRNSDIHNRLKVDNILEDLLSYQNNWTDHLKLMDWHRIPKLAYQHQPRGRWEKGRPRRKWRDHEHLEPRSIRSKDLSLNYIHDDDDEKNMKKWVDKQKTATFMHLEWSILIMKAAWACGTHSVWST
jgi:hypothetical protein